MAKIKRLMQTMLWRSGYCVCNFQRPLMCEIINNQSFYYKSINPYHRPVCDFDTSEVHVKDNELSKR
jgi:hypothetical protein